MLRRPPVPDPAGDRVEAAFKTLRGAPGGDMAQEQREDELLSQAEAGITQAAGAIKQLKEGQIAEEGHGQPSGGEPEETGSPSAMGQA